MSQLIIRSDGGAVANSVAAIAHSFTSPNSTLVIKKGAADTGTPAAAQREPGGAQATDYPPTFNYVLLAVIIITVLCGAAVIYLAQEWPEPSDLQKNAFAAMDFGWKAGLGAIFGLLKGRTG